MRSAKKNPDKFVRAGDLCKLNGKNNQIDGIPINTLLIILRQKSIDNPA